MSFPLFRAPLQLLLIATLMLLVTPFSLQAATAIGRVAVLQGEAESIADGSAPRALQLGSDVYMNERLHTMDESKLQIIFSDKTTLTLGPSSSIVIDKYVYQPDKSTGEFLATTTKGFFRMITGNISRLFPDRVKVRTPEATIGIRGCLLAWSVDSDDGPLGLLYLGGLQGRERGIYAENSAGMRELFEPEEGVRIRSSGGMITEPSRWPREAMTRLLGQTLLHLPPRSASSQPDSSFNTDIDAPDDSEFGEAPDISHEAERARGQGNQSPGNDLAPGYNP